jgi:hypothetical protein
MTEKPRPKAEAPTQDSPCQELPKPPDPPKVPERDPCTPHCKCPPDPNGPPASCFDDVIRDQNIIVKKAERAKVLVDELTAIQATVVSAQAGYTQGRYEDLKGLWGKQDEAIAELIRKLVCAVGCWECLLECRLCKQLVEARALDELLNGPGDLDTNGMGLLEKASSLYDVQYWHQRNVANMQARLDRIKGVLAAWEKPSDTLGDVLDKNGKLIEDTQKIVSTDPLKAVFDVFMTLVPRHWQIRPRDATSAIDAKYVKICECREESPEDPSQEKGRYAKGEGYDGDDGSQTPPDKCKCDEGTPDDCCGPDVGIPDMRQRLIGPLPYIVDPKKFPGIICCLTKYRLTPASDLLADAQAQLAGATARIEQVGKALADKSIATIEAAFRAGVPTPFDCRPYTKKCDDEPAAEGKDYPRDVKHTERKAPEPMPYDSKDHAR